MFILTVHIAHLVHIVAELALSDGPWALVVPLEGGYLATHQWGVSIAIVVHPPVVHRAAKVCKWHEQASATHWSRVRAAGGVISCRTCCQVG
jgi:hypothetical protein